MLADWLEVASREHIIIVGLSTYAWRATTTTVTRGESGSKQ